MQGIHSRVYGIAKDLIIISIFFSFLYGVTHNSIVRPTPFIDSGVWSIELHQRPLALGLAGHNFIVMRDANGHIVSALHGLPTDITTGAWKYIGRNKTDVLKVFEFTGEENNKQGESYGITLTTGTEDEIQTRFHTARMCGALISEKNIPYPPYGVSLRSETENSNSVAYTLVTCMNLPTKHIGLFTPGWGKNLLEE